MLRSGRERFPTGPGFVNGELVKDAKPDRKAYLLENCRGRPHNEDPRFRAIVDGNRHLPASG